jgi:DNA-binding NarL/FixJ family response regulator
MGPIPAPARARGAATRGARQIEQAAVSLDIGEETVKTHVRHVLAKLGAENRAQAAVRALARGVVSPEDLATD